jgi:hypothetical protein
MNEQKKQWLSVLVYTTFYQWYVLVVLRPDDGRLVRNMSSPMGMWHCVLTFNTFMLCGRCLWNIFTLKFTNGRLVREEGHHVPLAVQRAWLVTSYLDVTVDWHRPDKLIRTHSYVLRRWLYRVIHHRPDDGGSKHVGTFLPDYTAQHPRRHPSSCWDSMSKIRSERYLLYFPQLIIHNHFYIDSIYPVLLRKCL